MTTEASSGQVPTVKKKRGPKKKIWSPQVRQQRQMVRRNRANARERTRMHGLNRSLEILRSACPMFANQRLSKIDILRFARNYIKTLSEILQTGQTPDILDYARALTKDLSQGTINLIAGHLQVSPHLLWYPDAVLIPDHFLYDMHRDPLGSSRHFPLPFLPANIQDQFATMHNSENYPNSLQALSPYRQPSETNEVGEYAPPNPSHGTIVRSEDPRHIGLRYPIQDLPEHRIMPDGFPGHSWMPTNFQG